MATPNLNELRASYQALDVAARSEPDPEAKAQLEAQRDQAYTAMVRAGFNSDIQQKSAAVAPKGPAAQPSAPTVVPGAGVPLEVPDQQTPVWANIPPAEVRATPEAPPTISAPTAASPAASAQDSGIPTLAEYTAASRKGGGGGGMSVRAAAYGAGAAHQDAVAATQAQQGAITARADATAEAGKLQGSTIAGVIGELKAADTDWKVRFEQHRAEARRTMDESRAAAEDFKRTASEGSLAQSLGSGGAKFGAAISIALGALSAGLTKSGVNPGLQVLNARIDADLRERAERLRGKQAHLDHLDRLLARNMDLMQDDTSALAATKAGLLEGLKLDVQRQAAISGGQDAQLAAKQTITGMDAEIARAGEAAANQQLLLAQKRAAAGRKSPADIAKEYQQYVKSVLENRKLGAEVDKLEGVGGQPKSSFEARKFIAEKIQASGVNEWGALQKRYRELGGSAPSSAARLAVAYGQGDGSLTALAKLPLIGPLLGLADDAARAGVNYSISKFAPEEVERAQAVNAMVQLGVRMLNRGTETEGDRTAIRDAIFMLRPSSPPEQVDKGIRFISAIQARRRMSIYAVDRQAAADYESELRRIGGSDDVSAPQGATGQAAGATGQIGQ
jgi:hypothetical protein